MKPPFTIRGWDKNISLELLSYKTAFLVALDTGARGSELVALSRASHNLEYSTLASGAKHASIRMVPKFIPKNQRPEIIPEPMKFPGIAHLFPNEPERLICPVRALSLYIVKSAERAQDDSQEKLFVISNLLPKCSPRIFVAGLLRPFAWCMKILRSLIYRKSRPMTSGESPHQLLSTGILLWKNYVDWLAGNRLKYSYAIISETWLPIRNSRTSLWWPHGRLSCDLVS